MTSSPSSSWRTLAALVASMASVNAQSLVADIRPGLVDPGGTFSTQTFYPTTNRLYFEVRNTTWDLTDEVWATDGTPNGAHRVFVQRGTLANSGLYCTELPNGLVLFVTDGTMAGTSLVADVLPGPGSGVDLVFGRLGNVVLFSGDDGQTGSELWATDGTAAGTMRLKDIAPGPSPSLLAPGALFQGRYYFVAFDAHGAELWVTDGTTAGTQLFADLNPSGSSSPGQFRVLGARLLFAATDATHGRELWVTDGTPAGTVLLADIRPGTNSSSPTELTAIGSSCMFAANDGVSGKELWCTDGVTVALVADIQPGAAGGNPNRLAAVNGQAVFVADDGSHGFELWHSDGTAGGTALLADLTPGAAASTFSSSSSAMLSNGSQLVIPVNDGVHGLEPYVTDGTPAGTFLLQDINPAPGANSGPVGFALFQGLIYFSASDGVHGRELWTTDLTPAGTVLAQQLAPPRPASANIHQVVALGDRVVFDADDGVHGQELWVSDGTAAGTQMLGDLEPAPGTGSSPTHLTAFAGNVYFAAGTAANGVELWRTDGTPAGTTMVADLQPGPDSSTPQNLTIWNGSLYFSARLSNRGLWRTDGTTAGTTLVANIPIVDFSPAPLIALPNWLIIEASAALYRTDGTPAGTALVDSTLSVNYNSPTIGVGDYAYFFGHRGNTFGLWRSNGTALGTQPVTNFNNTCQTSVGGTYRLAALRNRVVIVADDDCTANSGVGIEPWITDGTPAGTSLLADIRPGLGVSSNPQELTSAFDRVFFVANDGVHGRELWVTDGTSAGTTLVADFEVGAGSSMSACGMLAVGVGRRVLAAAHAASTGTEFRVSDGTTLGTQLLVDLNPGPENGLPGEPFGLVPPIAAVAGGRLFFVGDDGISGPELFSMPFDLAEAAEAETFGSGCSGSNGVPAIGYQGVPALGDNDFAVDLAFAAPLSAALLLANELRSDVPLGGGCTLYPSSPVSLLVLTAADGTAQFPLPLPNTPTLIGAQLVSQWAVLDAAGAFANLAAFSNGLRVRLGRS